MTATSVRRDDLVATGLTAGLDRVGVAAADPFGRVRTDMAERAAAGMTARLRFTFKDPERATDVSTSFPWARRLVVGIRSYLPAAGTAPSRPGHGRVARFAVEDPYGPLSDGLRAIADELRRRGHRAEVLVDDDRLVDRAAAVRAGVAWWGKSTMALTPGLGPWFVIGSVVTDAELDVDAPMRRGCGTCDACLPACPTGALVAPGVLDARKCLAAIAQSPGVIPRQWRPAMGDRLYGCDDCLDACPPGLRLMIRSTDERGSVPLEWVLAAADETLLDRFPHFYLPGRSARFLRRNAIVAMGNDGDPGLFETVALHVGHRDWLLRAHAVWALARLGSPRMEAVLEDRLRRERQPEVRQELEAELQPQTSGA
ncbi:MAG TPA: 4Fe-4S double cluster binding domain-containing protein [Acidimicrobiia bacterium]|nr:4Fe-4S double cluster binding domain-containing protein [Acidimicrobiia bacterium]